MRILIALICSLIIHCVPFAQEGATPAERIIDEEKNDSQVMEILDHLVNKIGPRLTGSDRCQKACEWAAEKFKEWGLKNVRIEKWGEFKVGFNRGPWYCKMIEPEQKDLTIGFDAWTAGTDGVVKGEAVICPKTEEEIKSAEGTLKGKWVFDFPRSASKSTRDKLNDFLEKEGIAGVMRQNGGELIVTGGNNTVSWDKLPKKPNLRMVEKQYKELKELLTNGTKVVLEISVKNEFKKGPIDCNNVIAEIPGTEKPDEVVIIGGHIDSWDGATGTTDNGTGTSTTLEAARILSKLGVKPKRTIRFMLWSGEEQGLLGSRGWIDKHKDELSKISAVLVHDGGTNYVSGINSTKQMVPIFEKVFASVLELDKDLPFKIKEVKSLPLGIGSDHDSFLQRGVPGFFWNQSRTKDKGQNYNHEHHTQYDTYSAAVPDFQKHTAMVVAIGALGIANLDEMLPREGILARSSTNTEERRRMLGINCDDELVISNIVEGSAAEKGGLQEGDKILKVGKTDVSDMESLREAIQKAEKKSTVTIQRDGKEKVINVEYDR